MSYLLTREAISVLKASECLDMFPTEMLFATRSERAATGNPKFITPEPHEPSEVEPDFGDNEDFAPMAGEDHKIKAALRGVANTHSYTFLHTYKMAGVKSSEDIWSFLTQLARGHNCRKPSAEPSPEECAKKNLAEIIKFCDSRVRLRGTIDHKAFRAFSNYLKN